jgi:hypothetical protein
MTSDSINDELLKIKHDLAGRFGNDLERIVADAKSRERGAITLPPRRFTSLPTGLIEPDAQPASGGQAAPAAD